MCNEQQETDNFQILFELCQESNVCQFPRQFVPLEKVNVIKLMKYKTVKISNYKDNTASSRGSDILWLNAHQNPITETLQGQFVHYSSQNGHVGVGDIY